MKFIGRSYDRAYNALCERIMAEGVMDVNPRPHYADGTPAHALSIFNHEIRITPDMVPLLLSKKVFLKKAVEEILWIWQKRSNHVGDLQALGNHIWDEWSKADGTIGKAYGYQLAKTVDDTGMNQVDHLIHRLKTDPESRRHIVTLWNIEEGHEMVLKPCVYETHWVVIGKRLHLKVYIRSSDTTLGEPFNVIQYYILHKLIAREVGIEAGDVIFSITIPHIYDRHIEGLRDQLDRFYRLDKVEHADDRILTLELDDVPFYEFSYDNVHIHGYDSFGGEPLKRYEFEKAI